MAADPSPRLAATAAATRHWRLLASLAIVVYLVGSHWPRLRFPEVAGGPSSDKIVHFFSFLILTTLVWRARWFTRLWSLFAAGLAFAAFDEFTQAILPIERFFNLDDLVGDFAGLCAALAVIHGTAPLTSPPRGVARLRQGASALLAARLMNWAQLAVAAALGAAVGVPLAVMGAGAARIDPLVMGLIGGGVGAAAGGFLALELGVRARIRTLREHRGCPACGAASAPVGRACACCGEPLEATIWAVPDRIRFAGVVAASAVPLAIAALGLGLAVAVLPRLPGLAFAIESLEPITRMAVLAGGVVVAGGLALRSIRARLQQRSSGGRVADASDTRDGGLASVAAPSASSPREVVER